MATATRIYKVTTDGKPDRLVRAASQAQAINHVSRPMFSATPAEQDDLVALVGKGVAVEVAGDD